MICRTVRPPMIERSEPESTSWVDSSISSEFERKRWAAARIISCVPPTFTTATAWACIVMPSVVCASVVIESRRERSEIVNDFCTNGSTKTPPPVTTFCPDRSRVLWPVVGSTVSLPLPPVTMIASSGLAIRYRLIIMSATSTRAINAPKMPIVADVNRTIECLPLSSIGGVRAAGLPLRAVPPSQKLR